MTVLSDYIGRMVEGGMDMDEAMQIAAELFAAGVASVASRPSSGALRTRKWRHKASQSVTCDTPKQDIQNVTKRHETSQSVTSDRVPISIRSNKKIDRSNRGSRITPDWAPSDAERSFAKQEGFSDSEVDREAGKFRDHWLAQAGARGVKLDWSATWRKWVRNAAQWAGKSPPAQVGGVNPSGFYAKFGSEEQDAWDRYGQEKRGKAFPRDKHGGWNFPAQWPPEYKPQDQIEMPPIPPLRAAS